MTPAEIAAYNAGVAAVVDLARRSADRLEAKTKRPLPESFAIEALRAIADEAEHMIRPAPSDPAPTR